jgi:hypothetical protein
VKLDRKEAEFCAFPTFLLQPRCASRGHDDPIRPHSGAARFLAASRHKQPDATPIWFKRQVGRCLAQYRALRHKSKRKGWEPRPKSKSRTEKSEQIARYRALNCESGEPMTFVMPKSRAISLLISPPTRLYSPYIDDLTVLWSERAGSQGFTACASSRDLSELSPARLERTPL